MSEAKVWTPEEREAAALAVALRKFGHVEDVTKAELTQWAKVSHGDLKHSIDLQCELNEARKLLEVATHTFEFGMIGKRLDWAEKRRAWLKRNTEGK